MCIRDRLMTILEKTSILNDKTLTLGTVKIDYESHFDDFELFWYSKFMKTLKDKGLLVL